MLQPKDSQPAGREVAVIDEDGAVVEVFEVVVIDCELAVDDLTMGEVGEDEIEDVFDNAVVAIGAGDVVGFDDTAEEIEETFDSEDGELVDSEEAASDLEDVGAGEGEALVDGFTDDTVGFVDTDIIELAFELDGVEETKGGVEEADFDDGAGEADMLEELSGTDFDETVLVVDRVVLDEGVGETVLLY